jgi:phosphatidylinositol-3-phosphatase
MRWVAAVLLVFVASVAGISPAHAATPAVKHVWIITLENESADTTFAPNSPAHYLNNTLRKLGVFVPNYYGTGHASLDNYVAMVSGQGANPETQGDCPFYHDVLPGAVGLNGQAAGTGCVYPTAVKTIGDQLAAKGLKWRQYAQDMGNDTSREAATCAHPALNTQDNTEAATPKDNYATRHNGFMYFHSVVDEPSCQTNVVSLAPLATDLASAATTPSYSFITPSLCEDGHDAPCADGRPGGLVSADAFLAKWVPAIMASPAYRDGGLLIINFDEASTSDATACCGEQPNPGGSPRPGIGGPGGGRTGAVVLSPFTLPGTVSNVAYNHYSLLRSIEDIFAVGHLGFAGVDGLAPFGADIYSQPNGPAPAPTTTLPVPVVKARSEVLPRTGGEGPALGLALVAVALVVVRVRGRGVARRNAA